MSEIRKVCILENGAEIPLTASIADENKQALAYSMLYHLAGNGLGFLLTVWTFPLIKTI